MQRCHPVSSDRSSEDGLWIVAAGGSMTAGRMNCLGAVPRRCTQPLGDKVPRWSNVLRDLLRRALPACNVRVHMGLDDSARETTYGMRITTAATPLVISRLMSARDDLVIEDYTINNIKGWHTSEHTTIAAAFETFVRHTMSLQPPLPTNGANSSLSGTFSSSTNGDGRRMRRMYGPQLVHIESFARFPERSQKCEYSKIKHLCSPPPPCSNESEPVHLEVARHYAVPVISFMLGACHHHPIGSAEPARRLWRASCTGIDLPGSDCDVHPGPTTHRVYALLLAHYVVSQALAVAVDTEGGSGGDGAHFSDRARSKVGHSTFERQPSEMLQASRSEIQAFRALPGRERLHLHIPPPGEAGATLMSPSQLNQYVGCRRLFSAMDVSSSCDENRRAPSSLRIAFVRKPDRNTGWTCYEDVPMKPGWISTYEPVHALDHEIEFSMLLSRRGSLVVSYLRSYAGMGSASVYLKEFPECAVQLDGAWSSHTSQSDLQAIPVKSLLPMDATNASSATVALMARGGSSMHEKQGSSQRVVLRSSRVRGGKFKLLSLASC